MCSINMLLRDSVTTASVSSLFHNRHYEQKERFEISKIVVFQASKKYGFTSAAINSGDDILIFAE